jgi:hypothetical protein
VGVKTCYCPNPDKIRELKEISETFINGINIQVNIDYKKKTSYEGIDIMYREQLP